MAAVTIGRIERQYFSHHKALLTVIQPDPGRRELSLTITTGLRNQGDFLSPNPFYQNDKTAMAGTGLKSLIKFPLLVSS